MSNPLLRPNDPRFAPRDVHDEQGRNRFADGAGEAPVVPEPGDAYAATTNESRPFVPHYETQQQPRRWLIATGVTGWIAAILGMASLGGVLSLGWICPLVGVCPAALGWLSAVADMRAIDVGAIDERARSSTRLAMWIGFSALAACLTTMGSMIYRQVNFLPDLF